MGKVQEKLRRYSADDLCKMILEWAKSTHPDEREEFLLRLVLPSPEKPIVADSEILKSFFLDGLIYPICIFLSVSVFLFTSSLLRFVLLYAVWSGIF